MCATFFYIEFSFFRNKTSKIDYLKDQWLEFSSVLCGESNNNTDSVEKYSGNIFHESQLLIFPFQNPMLLEGIINRDVRKLGLTLTLSLIFLVTNRWSCYYCGTGLRRRAKVGRFCSYLLTTALLLLIL